nr:basic helix-loop-helix transcription factor [Loropetalum chinense var. rubrum]
MEKCFYPGWQPEEANLVQYYPALNQPGSNLLPIPWLPQCSPLIDIQKFPPSSRPVEGIADDRATATSKSHRQAEKRRRERINAQLSTLRKLIPKSDKMDKAALLGSVVDYVKELERKATEIGQGLTIPSEIDEVTVDFDNDSNILGNTNIINKDRIFIKASICCDDRPDLISQLIAALKGLSLTTVKAEMSTLSGRIRNILILCSNDSSDNMACLSYLKQSIQAVLSRVALSSSASIDYRPSKRQRVLFPAKCSY